MKGRELDLQEKMEKKPMKQTEKGTAGHEHIDFIRHFQAVQKWLL